MMFPQISSGARGEHEAGPGSSSAVLPEEVLPVRVSPALPAERASGEKPGPDVSSFPVSATLIAATGSRAMLTTADHPAPREVLLMAAGDYLGLGMHPEVVGAALRATRKFGWGSGAGDPHDPWHAAHEELERRLARLVGTEAVILFPSRYGALVATVSALRARGDLLFVDAPGNEALVQGGSLARARLSHFHHADPDDLLRRLRRAASRTTCALVATEGVYASDGCLAPLAEMRRAASEAGALLLVDDTHGLGVIGEHGRGSPEACGIRGEVDLIAGCLGGVLGGTGAFVGGARETIDFLRQYARSRLDSPPPPAAASVSAMAALRILETEPELRTKLWRNICFMRESLRARGFATGPVESALIPVPVGDEKRVLAAKGWLLERGIYVAHLVPPLVPPEESRLRLSIKAQQTEGDLEGALEILEEAAGRYGLVH